MLSTGKNINFKVVAYDNNAEYCKLLIVSAVQCCLLINWYPIKRCLQVILKIFSMLKNN